MVIQKQLGGEKNVKLWAKTALFTLFLIGLALSVAFPYGIGFVVFLWIIALAGAVCGVGIICYGLLKDILSRTATFQYTPTVSYMTGKKTKKKKKEEVTRDEESTDN